MREPASSRNRFSLGMTLIEILVVLAIIGILSALIYPVRKGIDSANRTKCLNNLRQIGMAAETYIQENNKFPDLNAWPAQLGNYLVRGGNIYAIPAGTKTIFWCPAVTVPSEPGSYNGLIEYGINAQGYAGLGRFATWGDPIPPVDSKRFAFMDATGKNVWDNQPARIPSRHGSNNYNALFADGHVENMSTQQFPLGSIAWRNLFWGYQRY